MRKYLVLVAVVLALATYEAAYACSAHTGKKAELQPKFSGGKGRGAGGGAVQVKNPEGSGSVLNPDFFKTLNQGLKNDGLFSTALSGGEAGTP